MHIVLSGSSGWIGQTICSILKQYYPSISLHLLSRNFSYQPFFEPFIFIHAAFPSRSRLYIAKEYLYECQEVQEHALRILRNPLCQGMIYPSSGAVYASPADLYGLMKRCDEIVFQEEKKRIIIPRIFNLSGKSMTHRSSYLLGSLIDQALAGTPLTIQSMHRVYRSFLLASDLIQVLINLWKDELFKSPIIFDACGEKSIEAYELAKEVKIALKCHDLPIQCSFNRDGPISRYSGDPTFINECFIKYNIFPKSLHAQIKDSAGYHV